MKWLAGLLLWAARLPAWQAPDPSPDEIERIIQRMAEKETEFARARENYTYRQRYRFEELGPDRRPVGRLEMEADIIFNKEGKRIERVTYAPMNTLRNIIFTPEDEQDMRNVQPFVFTLKELPNYRVRYIGREKIDEIDCFVFAVKPKTMVEGQRYFAGIVWVDDRDLQIVKTYGRGVGTGKRVAGQRFPKFETWREQIDGKYWFPTYTVSNDVLNFESGAIPIRLVITYRDYKQFKAETTITFEGVDEPAPAKPPAKKQ
ncbi:MAG: outer membrane lipoprotein-sorting protein [Bryobacteraceae bacterium]|nr:outer membrane lipoprotein-sorting protein [Bryobacteraceae bacterium]